VPTSGERPRALLAAFTVLAVAFSFGLFSLPVFYPALVGSFHWSRAQAAGGGSIVLLLIGILGPLSGKLVDRTSPKAVLLCGIAVSALALSMLSATRGLTWFYLFCALLGIGSAATSLVPASMLIAPWFAGKRGLAVGLINAGVGVGGFLAPNLTRFLIQNRGIPQAFIGLAVCLSIPFLATLALAPGATAAARVPRNSPNRIRIAEVVRLPMFWTFGPALFFAAHALTGIQQHLALYLTGQGISAASAALSLSVLLGASTFGKLIGGRLADAWSARISIMISVGCLVAAITGLLAIEPRSVLVYACAAVFGLGYGGVFNAPPLIAFEFFGTEGVGAIVGLFMLFFGLGTSSGGLVAGFAADLSHTYRIAFAWDLASCFIALALLAGAGRWVAGAPATAPRRPRS
jgi:MFS family permease